MNQRKDDGSEIVTVIAIVGAIIGVIAIAAIAFVIIGLLFLTAIFTALALLAWFRPLRIGSLVIEPAEARAFIIRGLGFAAFALVVFGACVLFLEKHFPSETWLMVALGGYVIGSVVMEWVFHEAEQDAAATPPAEHLPAPPPALPAPKKPFEFATWDDEEASR